LEQGKAGLSLLVSNKGNIVFPALTAAWLRSRFSQAFSQCIKDTIATQKLSQLSLLVEKLPKALGETVQKASGNLGHSQK